MQPYIAVPLISALIYRAWSKKSLTPLGIFTAFITAIIHCIHPWSVFTALLAVFFLAGSSVTKIKHDFKARLTLDASGSSGGEGSRTHVQVLANSVVASVLILAHYGQLRNGAQSSECWPFGADVLVIGIVSNYAAVTADTFSSELGILSKSKPRLLTSLNLREVPPGTNGGVTLLGTGAGALGSFLIAITSTILLPFCTKNTYAQGWTLDRKLGWILFVTVMGTFGSLLDSALGGWLQASVVDVRTGKVVEGAGGQKVLIQGHMPSKKGDVGSRKIGSGHDILDNNGVNLLMACLSSLMGMVAARLYWSLIG